MDKNPNKLSWQGKIVSVQPRIRLLRSYDQRQHNYLGYALRIQGVIDDEDKESLIGIGKGAQAKHQFRVGDHVSGKSLLVADERLETVEYYKTSALKLIECPEVQCQEPPPWIGLLTPGTHQYERCSLSLWMLMEQATSERCISVRFVRICEICGPMPAEASPVSQVLGD